MKEITTVLTVQITVIAPFKDENADEWERVKEGRTKQFIETLGETMIADDVLLLNSQTFIRDMKEEEME